ncbi:MULTISPECIES: gamma-glutamyl-gamma-aminobutyrate hydrolase family protein [Streptomyces]|uniref:Gamma-glutamyl-gamma-aminobutyrate hydrolase family protein n=1 Tax=Streptomyces doudnae TaxID=3075536 RepID=A0ABD5EYM5_9ACTN|nr:MULTISPECIES: gamma-glutamyl-gamma-aminobutyrate hydrolase family protein [unclassified Streptomyces]MDT0439109.1 gamma-glutamyl-gamma-aminobutyrate hydrolase family protein [Streptomyces sp. DSM 41981]MYQ67355.1 gamma-glutamyl-gamma-aminobutyrate hydrolase family protein [Streptomyces sp. SID4950]SCE33683.1 gamma-glutamyl-gamma-aminobutyrate hydrolase [Streptomyces sp. SolWspMP-5a-2]
MPSGDGGAVLPLVALACVREDLDGVAHAAVRQVYVSALEEVAGCAVALVQGPAAWLPAVLDRFDGVVLGGHESNVAPERYGAPPAPGPRAPERDALALNLLPSAITAGIPFLGICRGLQELNVAYGGTLRDIGGLPIGAAHREDLSLPRDGQYLPAHDVAVTPGGPLHEIVGQDTVRVNSLHGQAVDRLGSGLVLEAASADGVVEAVSVADASAFALAVQWHPEWYAASDPVSKPLFNAFGAAAAAHARRRG